eukprot:TRINITY_DN2011_c0_g3_i1.p1 TRINITY_DN2011_c0_g3~~TRINITY_DN2011_c0_g3_i1.p1  ORF type:complete len:191 (-),score=78.21 TRINITY_DN2011_c0_g3_i1:22-594(-)
MKDHVYKSMNLLRDLDLPELELEAVATMLQYYILVGDEAGINDLHLRHMVLETVIEARAEDASDVMKKEVKSWTDMYAEAAKENPEIEDPNQSALKSSNPDDDDYDDYDNDGDDDDDGDDDEGDDDDDDDEDKVQEAELHDLENMEDDDAVVIHKPLPSDNGLSSTKPKTIEKSKANKKIEKPSKVNKKN